MSARFNSEVIFLLSRFSFCSDVDLVCTNSAEWEVVSGSFVRFLLCVGSGKRICIDVGSNCVELQGEACRVYSLILG